MDFIPFQAEWQRIYGNKLDIFAIWCMVHCEWGKPKACSGWLVAGGW